MDDAQRVRLRRAVPAPAAEPEHPRAGDPAGLLPLQRTAGNAAVARLVPLLRQPVTPAPPRTGRSAFATAVAAADWPGAFHALDALGMRELLTQLRDARPAVTDLWTHVTDAPADVRVDRLRWADSVVSTRSLVTGGPTAELDDAVAFLVAKLPADRNRVFGWPLSNIGPNRLTARFTTRLQDGERRARELVARSGTPMLETQTEWEIDRISCGGGGNHARGCAVDINFDSCPYVIGEAGERTLDDRGAGGFDSLAQVYDRIARVMLSRAQSAVPQLRSGANKTGTADTSAAAGQTYDRLRGEHQAMRDYFNYVGRPDADLQELLDVFRAFEPIPGIYPTLTDPATLRRQIALDYLALGGTKANLSALAGTLVNVTALPNPPAVNRAPNAAGAVNAADRPFAGGNATRRPEAGFLNVRREIVLGLTAAGMRWGASEMGGESGDIMHFDAAGDA